jgi:hypothetical protein
MDPEGNWVWLVFNAAMATYDGYQAYKNAKTEGKRGYKLALAVAWAVAGNYIKVGKVYKYLKIAKSKKGSPKQLIRGRAFVDSILKKYLTKNEFKKIGSSIPDAIKNGKIYEIKDAKYVYKSRQFRDYYDSGMPIILN